MAVTQQSALSAIGSDQQLLFGLLAQLTSMKVTHHQMVQSILESVLIESLVDSNGYLHPNALTLSQISELENDLLGLYSIGNLNEKIEASLNIVDARLLTIDDLMGALEMDAFLGNSVFDMETIQQNKDDIAQSYIRGAFGDGDFRGSVPRIRETIQRYRQTRGQPQTTLRLELMDTLRIDSNIGENHADAIARSLTVASDRELKRVQAAEAGVETGLYAGPFDDVIRPFCDKWLGQVMEYSFWDTLHNDMPPGVMDTPVSFFCGGINCRHRIIPWRLEWSGGTRDLRHEYTAMIQHFTIR